MRACGETTKNVPSTSNSTVSHPAEMSREKGQKSDFDILKSKYRKAKAIVSNKASYYTANKDKIKGVWKLVEAQTPQASHDESTFNKTKGFPCNSNGSTINNRGYEKDEAARENVLRVGGKFDGTLVFS